MSAEDFFLSAEEFVQQHQALMLKVLREYSQYPEGTHSTPGARCRTLCGQSVGECAGRTGEAKARSGGSGRRALRAVPERGTRSAFVRRRSWRRAWRMLIGPSQRGESRAWTSAAAENACVRPEAAMPCRAKWMMESGGNGGSVEK